MTRGRIARLFACLMFRLPVVALLVLLSGCSKEQCLLEPGCGPQPSSPSVPAVLEIASFSAFEYEIPGDFDCSEGCEAFFVDVIEKTGAGRATILSIGIEGPRFVPFGKIFVPPSFPRNEVCAVEAGQRRTILGGIYFIELSGETAGLERRIVVRYSDGAGQVQTLSASGVVMKVAATSHNDTTCRWDWQ